MDLPSSTVASSSSVRSPERIVELREVVTSDHPRLEELKSRYQMVAESGDAYTHLFTVNHLYSDGVALYPIGWVLETNQRELVGHIGNICLAEHKIYAGAQKNLPDN